MSNFLLSKIVGVNFNEPTFKMVGGLGIDGVKIKYNWFLQADVKNAIIGEDKNGLIWYSGDWVDGTWEGGTWYSGKFHNGRWKGGNFYSYDIDQNQMMNGILHINCKDISKSQFLGGNWEGGIFHYGIFGHTNTKIQLPTEVTTDYIINNCIDYPLSGETYYDPYNYLIDTGLTMSLAFVSPIFMNGDFNDGWFNAAIFEKGNFYSGFINNSKWYDGSFYSGVFMGDIWYGGSFKGGDFSNGIWEDGTLSIFKPSIITRFGTNYKLSEITWGNGTYLCGTYNKNIPSGISYYDNTIIWKKGLFINGEFHSSLNLVDGVASESIDHSITIWSGGTFNNGTWYGGTFDDGIWKTGNFYNGIINNITWHSGQIKNCIWKKGYFIGGTISGGLFIDMKVYRGEIGN